MSLYFFFLFFWSYFDRVLAPSMEVIKEWIPLGINSINPYGTPLFNTVILLSSGVILTWRHSILLTKKIPNPRLYIILGLAFTFEVAQIIEFQERAFSLADGNYGSGFYWTRLYYLYMVLWSFLLFNLVRIILIHFSRTHH